MTTFAAEIKKAMEVRGVTVRDLAAMTELSVSMICAARSGDNVPTHANVDKLTAALDWQPLATASRVAHSGRCLVCRRHFVSQMRNGRRLYCTVKCQRTAQGRKRKKRHEHPYRVAKFRLADAQAAIAAFCGRCEPLGICRDNKCELRPESPLPFIALSAISRRVA